MDKLNRYHIFTDKGRKVTYAPTKEGAKTKAEAHGLVVKRVVSQPNPLLDARL